MNHTLKPLIVSLVFLLGIAPVLSQAQPHSTGEETNQEAVPTDTAGFAPVDNLLIFDTALMKHDRSMSMLQINALVERDVLSTQPTKDGGVEAVYEICFNVMQNDKVLARDFWKRRDWSQSAQLRRSNVRIPEVARYGLPPGTYKIRVRATDLLGKRYQQVEKDVTADFFTNFGLQASDPILASQISPVAGNDQDFTLMGIHVVPDAEPVYGDGRENLQWFLELYNLRLERGATHSIHAALCNKDGSIAVDEPEQTEDTKETDVPAWGKIDLAGVPEGDYRLGITVTDNTTGDSLRVTRKVSVKRFQFAMDVKAMNRAGLSPDSTSDEEVAREYNAIQVLVPNAQQKLMRRITDPHQKRILLTQLYTALDPDTATAVNEFRDEFLRRLHHANDLYGGSEKRRGWKRDRGRILLKYGQPDYIEDHSIEAAKAHAYQIWEYQHIEGGVIFVFVDRNDLGLYTLVHSTKHGELYAPGWRKRELFVQSATGSTSALEDEETEDQGIDRR